MELDDPPRERQAEAGALRVAPCPTAAPLERLEDPLVFRSGDPDARVADADLRLAADQTRASSTTEPRSGVNLTALVSRFSTTCLS